MKIKLFMLIIACLTLGACSARHTAYTAGGAVAGAALGYSYHHNDKDAAIGGLAGGIAGATLGEIEHRLSGKKYAKGFEEGYAQAKVDFAKDYWDQTTGKKSEIAPKAMNLRKFTIPAGEEEGVVYDAREIILEDYR